MTHSHRPPRPLDLNRTQAHLQQGGPSQASAPRTSPGASRCASFAEQVRRWRFAERPGWLNTSKLNRPHTDADLAVLDRAAADFKANADEIQAALSAQLSPVQREMLTRLLAEYGDARHCAALTLQERLKEFAPNPVRQHRLAHVRLRVRQHFGLRLSDQGVLDLEKAARRAATDIHLNNGLIKAITFQGHAMYPVLSNTGSALELATVYTYEMTLGLRQ